MFRIEVDAVGGHGCQRELKDGAEINDCGFAGCPDCTARRFVAALQAHGHTVQIAMLTHWPGQNGEVRDNLITKRRKGSF